MRRVDERSAGSSEVQWLCSWVVQVGQDESGSGSDVQGNRRCCGERSVPRCMCPLSLHFLLLHFDISLNSPYYGSFGDYMFRGIGRKYMKAK